MTAWQFTGEIGIAKVSQQTGAAVDGDASLQATRSFDKTLHVVFVLDPGHDEARLTGDEADRVRSIIEACVLNRVSNLTLVEEASGPTNLTLYFEFLQQHLDNQSISYEVNVLDDTKKMPHNAAPLMMNMVSAYRGRADVTASVRDLIEDIARSAEEGTASAPDPVLLEVRIAERTRLGALPEPDLMVFWGGRRNLGEAGVWMGAYSEFAFLDQPWHSFNADDLTDLLVDFGLRERRFGAV